MTHPAVTLDSSALVPWVVLFLLPHRPCPQRPCPQHKHYEEEKGGYIHIPSKGCTGSKLTASAEALSLCEPEWEKNHIFITSGWNLALIQFTGSHKILEFAQHLWLLHQQKPQIFSQNISTVQKSQTDAYTHQYSKRIRFGVPSVTTWANKKQVRKFITSLVQYFW